MKIRNFSQIKSLLFDHQNTRQTIFKNTFWLAIAETISRLLTFVLFIFAARILGANEYGKFSFVLAIIGLTNILHGFVSAEIITREFSREKEKEKEYPSILSLRVLLGIAAIIIIFICSFFLTNDVLLRRVIWILSVYWILNGLLEMLYAFFRARQRMEYESFFKITDGVLTTALGLIVIFSFPSLENLSYAYLAEGVILLGAALLFFHFRFYRLSLSWDRKVWKRMLSFSWPLALISIIATAYSQIDTAMMGFFGQMTQAGWYNAAFKITRLVLIPMALISQVFYPVLSRVYHESKEKIQKIFEYQTILMILLSVPLVVGGIKLAPRLINFFYGQDYAPSALAFQILIAMTGIIFFCESLRLALIVANQQKKLFLIILAGAIVNIILNLILIPRYSLYGAAGATLLTNVLVFILSFRFTLRFTAISPLNFKILSSFLAALIASFIMYLLISQPWMSGLPVIISVLAGIAVYLTSLFILVRYLNFIPEFAVLLKKS